MLNDERKPATQPPPSDPRDWMRAGLAGIALSEPARRPRRRGLFGAAFLIAGLAAMLLWSSSPIPRSEHRVAIPAAGQQPTGRRHEAPEPTVYRAATGQLNGRDFYSSAVSAGVDNTLVNDMTAALAFDFDFVREVRAGDNFETVTESAADGTRRRIVYVSLATAAKSVALYNFTPAHGDGAGWYDANGVSIVRGLMRTPVEGARVTSNFGMRMHPVLGFMRMHKGVDFGVPPGTKVFASGDGTVEVAREENGYGLYLRIKHSAALSTAYAHLARIAAGVIVNSPVRQGQVIAYSGDTGSLSTGPHLHYEVLVDGQQVNPLTYTTSQTKRLQGAALKAFQIWRDTVDRERRRQR